MGLKCAIGCNMPAIGIANLKGIAGSAVGISGTYALCEWHHAEATTPDASGQRKWANVEVVGWEPFPAEIIDSTPPTLHEEVQLALAKATANH